MNEIRNEQQPVGGNSLLRIAWQSTFVLLLFAIAGVAAPDTFGIAVAVVSLVMFGLGLVFLLLALLGGLRRSRLEEVTVSGLFLLHEAAPRRIQRLFLWCLVFQLVTGLTAAGLRPYTEIAFAVLAPTVLFGSAALWSAQHGSFAARGNDPS